jgi:hypothetical protein
MESKARIFSLFINNDMLANTFRQLEKPIIDWLVPSSIKDSAC